MSSLEPTVEDMYESGPADPSEKYLHRQPWNHEHVSPPVEARKGAIELVHHYPLSVFLGGIGLGLVFSRVFACHK